MVVCLVWGADLHMAQRVPLPITVSCSSKIQIGFTFLVPAHLGSPGKGPLNGCVCVWVSLYVPNPAVTNVWYWRTGTWDLGRCFVFPPVLCHVPSVLWCCWLGCRKSIRPVENWVVGCWHGYLSGARCRLAYGPADATATHCLLLQ